jgi:hypothetical protein
MSLPESQIIATLSTEIVYPVPSISFFNEPSTFFQSFGSEYVEDFKKQSEDPIIKDEFLSMSEITTKTNTIIANKSSEIFKDCINDNGFIVSNEKDANDLISAIRAEKQTLELTNNLLVEEVMQTGRDIAPMSGTTFDTIFIKQLRGENVNVDISDETLEKLANEFDVGFGTFDELENYFAGTIKDFNQNG